MNKSVVGLGGFVPDYENYTLSLLTFLCGKGSIDEKRALEIRAQLNEVFNERAAQYTKRASSSLSSAIAERIYRSVLFCCDVCLRDSGIEKSAEMLVGTDMAEWAKSLRLNVIIIVFRCAIGFTKHALNCL